MAKSQKPIKIKKPGDLRRRLGVKGNQKISASQLNKATHSKNHMEKKEALYKKNVLTGRKKK
jgi:hypothetical protein